MKLITYVEGESLYAIEKKIYISNNVDDDDHK